MKNLLLIVFTALTLSYCSKNNDIPQTPQDQLPAITTTGANTTGCLINGQVFLPKGYLPIGNLFAFYENGLNFGLGITENINGNLRTVNIGSLNQNLHDNIGIPLQLNIRQPNSKYGEYNINSVAFPDPNYYSTNSTVTGELTITYHNFNNAILSGTFWFDAINANGVKAEVRNGRFDIKY